MALRSIITLPDSKLHLPSAPVTRIDASIRTILDDMLETMYEAPGIGLAAVQIGVMERLVVVDIAKQDEPRAPLFLVNPEVVWHSEELSSYDEGCLSIPDFYEEVVRPEKVKVRYLDRDGAPREIEADGILSTVLQHEIDHLNGVLFVDHISKLKRDRINRKFEKAARQAREEGRVFDPRAGDRPDPPERRRRSISAP